MNKEKIKTWWNERKGQIKTALLFGGAGLAIGFIKGALTTSKIMSEAHAQLLNKIPDKDLAKDEEFYADLEDAVFCKVADHIRENGSMQLECSDCEPICIRIDQKD